MSIRERMSGNEAIASAMSAAMGSQAAGARTMTATSSCGLALMWEMLYVVASARLPVTLACVNRALTGPININADHSDSMGARDAGWIQLYSETNQEAYDNMLQANRIGEHPDVQLPVMVCQDGFITSHAVENIELVEDDKAKAFVGEYKPEDYLLNAERPIAVGPYDIVSYYMEHKVQQANAMKNAKKVILEVAAEFEKMTGRKYGLFEEYKLDGLLKIRVFRPFPMEEIAEALKHVKMVAVMDKSEGFSAAGGPVFAEVRSALYDCNPRPKMVNYVYGLGGRDVTVAHIREIFETLLREKDGEVKDTYRHFGVRG